MPHSPKKEHATLDPAAKSLSRRKDEHIRICLEKDVTFRKTSGFEAYEFEHNALPELSLSHIDTSTSFLGKPFRWPFFIEALTGGFPKAARINKNLAQAAEELGIGMGVGSQRAMLKDASLTYTYQVREVAPNMLLLGNIGATQLVGLTTADATALVERIGADGLAIHLNPAQELCQPEGDTDWRNVLAHIKRICEETSFPVIVKETGCGIAGGIAEQLVSAGVDGIDVAGAGGTSFTKVEYYRSSHASQTFFEWGIPTSEALRQCHRVTQIPLIASGGMRTGLQCAKAIALGASLAGFAWPLLKPALKSSDAVVETLTILGDELKKTMLLVGAKNIDELKLTKITQL